MTIEDKQTLERFAAACRQGLETLAAKKGSMFEGFPRGACGPASELLGRLLQERLGLHGAYVCGSDHPGLASATQSHAWVEVADCIIDITHDQFASTGVEGWVIPVSRVWHGRFRSVDRRKGFCMPSGWPMYPHDGYAAMTAALDVAP
jgi:hypothetical protein